MVAMVVAACGAINTPSIAVHPSIAQPTSSASPSALASLVPGTSPAIDCSEDVPLPGGCTAATAAILGAVSQFGLSVKSIAVMNVSWPCGQPFLYVGSSFLPACPPGSGPPTAWVEFFNSDKVAALSLTPSGQQIIVTVDAFGVPPTPGLAPA